jgi:hypothetical protein
MMRSLVKTPLPISKDAARVTPQPQSEAYKQAELMIQLEVDDDDVTHSLFLKAAGLLILLPSRLQ